MFDDCRVFDTGNNLDGTAAMLTGFYVNIEAMRVAQQWAEKSGQNKQEISKQVAARKIDTTKLDRSKKEAAKVEASRKMSDQWVAKSGQATQEPPR